jgi:RNA polymerase sigma factor (sigma-70 family)
MQVFTMSAITSLWQQSGQRQFERLIKPHLTKLYRLAYRLTRNQDDAEDLVQDMLIKLYPKLDKLKTVDNLATWLSRVLLNQYIDHYRQQQNMPLQSIGDENGFYQIMPDHKPQPQEVLETEINIRQVQDALLSLNKDQQLVLVLHEVEGYNLEEIRLILGEVSIGTLKSRLKRARDKLTIVLKKWH